MHLALPVVLLSASVAACSSAPPKRDPPPAPALATLGTARLAVANLASASGSLVSGRMRLVAEKGGVRISGVVGGLKAYGSHALQLHERGDCSAVDARSAGAYFDPLRGAGTAVADGNHGRIIADGEGVAQVDLRLPGAVLGGGAPNDIVGRALVVLGATRGASSARVACGVIAVKP